jgi:hypothetical protein
VEDPRPAPAGRAQSAEECLRGEEEEETEEEEEEEEEQYIHRS